jgi:hypothetical protein
MEKPDPMAPGAEDVAGENDQPFLTDEEEDGTKERAQDGKDQKPQDEADGVGGEDDEEDKPFITDEDAGKDTDRRIETEVDDSAKDEQKAENELADDHPADAQTHIDEAEKDLANSEQVPGESGDEGQIGTNPKEGDTCPVCSKGILRKKDQVSGTPKDPADEGSDEDKDENGDDKNPFASKDDSKKDKSDSDKKTSAVRPRHSHGEGTDVTMRPALAALNEQQKMIVAQRRQIAALREGFRWMSTMAGLGGHPKVAQILHYADENNPGQPVPTPAAEAPSVTTDEARAPDGMTDVTQIGESPVNDVAADAVEGVGQPYQTVLDEPLDLNEQDVTAPVAGTEGPLPTDQVITEVDVQTGGDRINDATEAFPWEMGPTTGAARQASTPARQGGRNRTMACLRLARLRIAVGTAHIADDLSLAAEIEGSDLPDESIDTEISTLDAVSKVQTQGSRQPVARNLVPRAANRVQRAAPSLGREDNGLSMVASGGSDDDSFLFE